jgi:D-beta-D-heptose 7-phosphate kinase/D-beta-D-heptose 1-phosphate adenosyltransferase
MKKKIYSSDSLIQILSARRRGVGRNEKTVFTNGCFDLLHVGHLRYLWEARTLGNLLIVALNDDDSVKRLKGPRRPILDLDDRLQVVAGLACVDFVTSFGEDTPVPLLERLKPDVLVKGGNYALKEVVGHELILEQGGEVRTLELTEGHSSTRLHDRVREIR